MGINLNVTIARVANDRFIHATQVFIGRTLCGRVATEVRPSTVESVTCGGCEDIFWSNAAAAQEAAQERAAYEHEMRTIGV